MKKVIVMLMLAIFSFGTFSQVNAQTPQTQTPATKHLKKDSTADKRYKENKTPKGPLTKSGKPDMRYKANKQDSVKKKS